MSAGERSCVHWANSTCPEEDVTPALCSPSCPSYESNGKLTEMQRTVMRARMYGRGYVPSQVEPVRPRRKIGRNAPCPCGSGKKYKKCHGK